jgi:signal peptidase II
VTPGQGIVQRLMPWIAIALAVVVFDQLTKFAIERVFEYGDVKRLTGFFNLVLTYNKGAAFSFLREASGWQGPVLSAVAVVASAVIVFLLTRHSDQRLFSLALSLILGGALGNLIDRLLYGHVIDFLDFHYAGWHWPAFNVADSAIVCGALLLVFEELTRMRKPALGPK